MDHLSELSWLERWALRILHRSPRLGLVIAKPYLEPAISWSVAQDDDEAVAIASTIVEAPELEPPSMRLERIYHLPAYGEAE